jgi:hypothetical protein
LVEAGPRANQSAAGIDKQSMADIEQDGVQMPITELAGRDRPRRDRDGRAPFGRVTGPKASVY